MAHTSIQTKTTRTSVAQRKSGSGSRLKSREVNLTPFLLKVKLHSAPFFSVSPFAFLYLPTPYGPF